MTTVFRIIVFVLAGVLFTASILASLIAYEVYSGYFPPDVSLLISLLVLLIAKLLSYAITSEVARCLRNVRDKQLKKGIRV